MFTVEGSFIATVVDVALANPPDWRKNAQPDDFDVCLRLVLKDNSQQTDWWRGEISANYCTIKNKTHMTQAQVTLETLRSVGFEGEDLTKLEEQLFNQDIPVTLKKGKANDKGKQYVNVYLGGGHDPIVLDSDEAKRRAARAAALFGNKAEAAEQAGGAATAPAAAGAAPKNPFDKR